MSRAHEPWSNKEGDLAAYVYNTPAETKTNMAAHGKCWRLQTGKNTQVDSIEQVFLLLIVYWQFANQHVP